MPRLTATALALGLAATPVAAEDRAGDFDYWVLSLSWNASWCEAEGDSRDAPQCGAEHDYGWLIHGLWPQYERGGWPEFCRTSARDPSRAETAAMTDVMGSSGLAWHEWKKHGRCSGLSAEDYFAAARAALASIRRPALLRELDRDVRLPASVVEEAFLDSNPALDADDMVVTCSDGRIAEARICLDLSLKPRACGSDVARQACTQSALLPAIR